MSKVDDLNRDVTSAIRFAEQLEDVKSEYTPEAYAKVSLVEQLLASELTYGTAEWAIAWRGAVRAAVKAGDVERAKALISNLTVNCNIEAEFANELNALLP